MTTIHAAVGATAPSALGSAGVSPVTGPRSIVPFGQSNIAAGDNADPLLSTPVQVPFCGVTAVTVSAQMIRPGSITGMSVRLSAAAAGSDAVFKLFNNGVAMGVSAGVLVESGEASNYDVFPSGTYPFVAGDKIDVRVLTGSGWSATTVDAAIIVEIETLT